MKTHHLLILIFALGAVFMLANWFNRPRSDRARSAKDLNLACRPRRS